MNPNQLNSNPSGSFSLQANPDLIKTSFDTLFNSFLSPELAPGFTDVNDAKIFRQERSDQQTINMIALTGPGLWDERNEQQNVTQDAARLAYRKTFTGIEFAKGLTIPRWAMHDAIRTGNFNPIEMAVTKFAERAYQTMNKQGFKVYANATSTDPNYLTFDGQPLLSNNHVTADGVTTFDNLISTGGILNQSVLEQGIEALTLQPDEDGLPGTNNPRTLFVSPEFFPEAIVLTESKLITGSNNNDINYVSAKYMLQVVTSPWMSPRYGLTSTPFWFLISQNVPVFRWKIEDLETWVNDYKMTNNFCYEYRGRFREAYGSYSAYGIVGGY